MIRSLRLTDIVAIQSRSSSFSNYARTKDYPGRKEASWSRFPFLIGQVTYFDKRRRSWVWIEENRIQGLVSIRRRCGPSTWEISSLESGAEGERIAFNLLDALGMVGNKLGISRFFLRLSVEANLMEIAGRSGFVPYGRQRLYARNLPLSGREGNRAGTGGCLRRIEEDYSLFLTYGRTMPERMRRAEGLTFEEWQDSRERSSRMVYGYERQGKMVGWVNVTRKGPYGCLEIFAPTGDDAISREVFFGGLSRLDNTSVVYCLAFTDQVGFCGFLEYNDFHLLDEHYLLVREQLVRIKQPYLVPARL